MDRGANNIPWENPRLFIASGKSVAVEGEGKETLAWKRVAAIIARATSATGCLGVAHFVDQRGRYRLDEKLERETT